MAHVADGAPSGWGLVAMTVLLLLFVGVSVTVGSLLFRNGRPGLRGRGSTAQRRLDRQFADGQFDERAYLRLSAELTERRPRRG